MDLKKHFSISHRPLKYVKITQPFGVNYVDFYTKLGLKGHNGYDFRATRGTSVFACMSGNLKIEENGGYGKTAWIETDNKSIDGNLWKLQAVYGHLDGFEGKNRYVRAGELIAYTDNTGKYTTADHLHFGIRPLYKFGNTWKYEDNGYRGWVDFDNLMEDKAWKEAPVMRRYDRRDVFRPSNPGWRPWHAFLNEQKVAMSLWRFLKRRPSNEQINACVYGGWDRETVKNPAMYPIWGVLTKVEYIKGYKGTTRQLPLQLIK